ncbi:MAG: ATP-binding protein [Caldilineaceae bacterium]
MLNTLTIKNYRLFNDFSIGALARVNLIVGTNNSGKSSLLEAIHLLTSDDARGSLLFILDERGEFVSPVSEVRYGSPSGGYQISQIFNGRSADIGNQLSISADKYSLQLMLKRTRPLSNRDLIQLTFSDALKKSEEDLSEEDLITSLIFERHKNGSEPEFDIVRVSEEGLLLERSPIRNRRLRSSGSRLITTNYLNYNDLARLWDNITLTPREDKVVEALQILEPHVERISFTSRQTSNSGILIRLSHTSEPIPLGSMGDGMRRILAIAASLVSVEDGALLVDEIDTGLYYGVQKDMWRLVLETALRQNAQVFATTHSWDCVRAFQQALAKFDEQNLGSLIRLDKVDDQITAVTYSAQELDIAMAQGIEVR